MTGRTLEQLALGLGIGAGGGLTVFALVYLTANTLLTRLDSILAKHVAKDQPPSNEDGDTP